MTAQPTVSEVERRRRWRLLLGPAVDDVWTDADSQAARDQHGAGDADAAEGDGADGDGSTATGPVGERS